MNDRIAEDADWKDGINIFRLRMLEEIKQINNKLEKLQQKENPQ